MGTKPQADGGIEPIDLDRQELEAILEHAKAALSEEEYAKLHAAMETLVFLTAELEKKRVSVQRLKQLLFGATTETTRKVMERTARRGRQGGQVDGGYGRRTRSRQTRPKPQGHGRNGAGSVWRRREGPCAASPRSSPGIPARVVKKGTVYESVPPGRLVRIRWPGASGSHGL